MSISVFYVCNTRILLAKHSFSYLFTDPYLLYQLIICAASILCLISTRLKDHSYFLITITELIFKNLSSPGKIFSKDIVSHVIIIICHIITNFVYNRPSFISNSVFYVSNTRI